MWASVVALKQMSRSLINWFLIHVGPLHSCHGMKKIVPPETMQWSQKISDIWAQCVVSYSDVLENEDIQFSRFFYSQKDNWTVIQVEYRGQE